MPHLGDGTVTPQQWRLTHLAYDLHTMGHNKWYSYPLDEELRTFKKLYHNMEIHINI